MKSKILGLLAVGLLGGPITAMATPVDMKYGAFSGIYARDCSVAPGCPDAGGGRFAPIVAYSEIFAPNKAAIAINTRGWSGSARALATGPSGQRTFWYGSNHGTIGAPTIKTDVYTSDIGRVSSGGWVLQSYTWNGNGPTERTIGGTLTFTQSGGWPSDGGSAIAAGIWVFTTGSSVATLLDTPGCSAGALTFGGESCIQNATTLARDFFEPTETSGPLDFFLDPITLTSDPIFILTSFAGFARLGGYVNAGNTFVTTFDSEVGLTPAATAVLEPGTLALLGLGLLGLGVSRRRKA